MDIDKALYEVGGKRPYQWLLFTIINICIYVPIAANTMFYLFIAWTPSHHCRQVSPHNSSETGSGFNANLSQCFEPPDGNNISQPCQHGWVYDTDPLTEWSIVSEWDLVCDYDYLAEIGETLSSVAAILGYVLIPPLSDKFGRKPVIFICLLLYVVMGTGLAFSPSLSVYYGLRFCVSFVVTFTSIGMVYSMELYSTRHRAFAGVAMEIYWVMAYFFLAMLMYFVRVWRHFVLCLVVPRIAFLGAYWLLPESPSWLLSVGRKRETVKVLKFLAKRNCVEWTPPPEDVNLNQKEETEQAEEEIPFLKQLFSLVKDPFLRRHTLMNCLYWFTNDNVYLGIILTSPSLAGDKYLSFTLGGLVEIPAYLLCFFVVPYSRRIPTIVFHVLAGVSLLVAALVIGLDLGGSHQTTILLVITLLGKFGISASFAVMILYTIELFPTNVRGVGTCFGKIFGRIGSFGAPFFAYWMKHNQWQPLTLMGTIALVTGFATFVLPETCDKNMPQSLQDIHTWYRKGNKVHPEQNLDVSSSENQRNES